MALSEEAQQFLNDNLDILIPYNLAKIEGINTDNFDAALDDRNIREFVLALAQSSKGVIIDLASHMQDHGYDNIAKLLSDDKTKKFMLKLAKTNQPGYVISLDDAQQERLKQLLNGNEKFFDNLMKVENLAHDDILNKLNGVIASDEALSNELELLKKENYEITNSLAKLLANQNTGSAPNCHLKLIAGLVAPFIDPRTEKNIDLAAASLSDDSITSPPNTPSHPETTNKKPREK